MGSPAIHMRRGKSGTVCFARNPKYTTKSPLRVTCASCRTRMMVHAATHNGGAACGSTRFVVLLSRNPLLVTCEPCQVLSASQAVPIRIRPNDVRHYGVYTALCNAHEPGWARTTERALVDCPRCLRLLKNSTLVEAHGAAERSAAQVALQYATQDDWGRQGWEKVGYFTL